MKLLKGVTVLKGYELYKKVLNLLGYINNDDSITSDSLLYKRAFGVINQILLDLKQTEIEDMNCEIKIPKACEEALSYGVAMMLSLIGGDSERNRLFTSLYNAKRAAALCENSSIKDVMPNVDGGAV